RQQADRGDPRDHEQGLQVLRWRRDARQGSFARRGSITRARRQAARLAVLDPVAAEALLHALQEAARAAVPDRLRARRSLYVGRFRLRIRLALPDTPRRARARMAVFLSDYSSAAHFCFGPTPRDPWRTRFDRRAISCV